MNKNIKKLCLSAILLGNLVSVDSFGGSFPIITKACAWAKQGNNAEIVAGSFVISFLAHQYYKHKTRPKDEDISDVGFKRRWNEIVHSDLSLFKKMKRLISFVDDFYVFGRRPKIVDVATKTIDIDGNEMSIKDKKTVIKGTGPITFLYDNVFDKLEEILKSLTTLGTFILLFDGLRNGQINLIFNPAGIKVEPTKDNKDSNPVPPVKGPFADTVKQ